MSKVTFTPAVTMEAFQVTKFRENSKDSVVYIHDDHTVEKPHQLTITSELPVVRKNNPGTVKTTLNARVTTNIGTAEEPKLVPVICKVQTSIPVGTSAADRRKASDAVASILSQGDVALFELLYTGIIPEGA